MTLDGSVFDFAGVNAYEAGTWYGVDRGCGANFDRKQLAAFFAALPPHSVVRVTATQGATGLSPATGRRTWAALDRLVAVAHSHGEFLDLVLSSQDGTCDDGLWHDPAWYRGGFRAPSTLGTGATSYLTWVREIVDRYRADPTAAMWEPVNEPEAATCDPGYSGFGCYGHTTCLDEHSAANALRSFFDAVGARIHAEAPRALVEAGFIGSGQCGTGGTDARYVDASPGLDVLSIHDYGAPTEVLPGDRFNGERVELRYAEAVHKPIIAGEMGIMASPDGSRGCTSTAERNAELVRKISGDLESGVSGVLAWDWVPLERPMCSFDIGPYDPYMRWLERRSGPILMSGRIALAELANRLGEDT